MPREPIRLTSQLLKYIVHVNHHEPTLFSRDIIDKIKRKKKTKELKFENN